MPKTGVVLSLSTGVDDRELDREEARLAFVSGPAWKGGEGSSIALWDSEGGRMGVLSTSLLEGEEEGEEGGVVGWWEGGEKTPSSSFGAGTGRSRFVPPVVFGEAFRILTLTSSSQSLALLAK